MKLATLPNGTPDGRLHLVSRDLTRAAPAEAAQTLQAALEDWEALAPVLEAQSAEVNAGAGAPFDPAQAPAPLPRAWQWLDGSAFDSHGDLMDALLGVTPGAVTAFGVINDKAGAVRFFIDESLLSHEVINCHPLVNTATTSIAPADLMRFIEATGHRPNTLNLAAQIAN